MKTKKIGRLFSRIIKKSIIFLVAILYISLVIALSFGSLIAGVFTMIPADFFGWNVSKTSYLGYYSTCSFAPFSTLILAGMSIVGFVLVFKLWRNLQRRVRNSNIYYRLKIYTQKALSK